MPRVWTPLKAICAALAFVLLMAAFTTSEGRAQSSGSEVITEEEAEAFFRTWVGMIDANTPVEEYLKYLPDGDFEQWSYTNAEIKNVAELRAYFEAAWGTIKQNSNDILSIETADGEEGRVEVIANVDWTAVTADDHTIQMPLTYRVTVGRGASSNDVEGRHPKIFKYAIRPTQ